MRGRGLNRAAFVALALKHKDMFMTDSEFDEALVAAVLSEAGLRGWRATSVVEAARSAGLDLARVRTRFPSKVNVLIRLGTMADQAALSDATPAVSYFTCGRAVGAPPIPRGVLAVLDAAAMDPALGLYLGRLSTRSMAWMLEGAGISAVGLRGMLRAQGLLGVWLWSVRAWREDDSLDLAATMTAVDKALDRAAELARYIGDDPPPSEEEVVLTPEPAGMPAAVPTSIPAHVPPIDPAI
jgi:ubiquinone biosynthesis protein COQ9